MKISAPVAELVEALDANRHISDRVDFQTLEVYFGTHQLGNAGEIADILPKDYPEVEGDVEPGDMLIMHSSTRHESPENALRSRRGHLGIHIQPIDEPPQE